MQAQQGQPKVGPDTVNRHPSAGGTSGVPDATHGPYFACPNVERYVLFYLVRAFFIPASALHVFRKPYSCAYFDSLHL